jgi:HPt (histidine-containing phosphotransfer) domain-containing protein
MEGAMARFDNDREFLKEMLVEFLNYIPERITELTEAVNAGNMERVKVYAHSIKGAVATLSADKSFYIIQSIEHRARSGDLSDVPSLIENLRAEMLRLKDIENAL